MRVSRCLGRIVGLLVLMMLLACWPAGAQAPSPSPSPEASATPAEIVPDGGKIWTSDPFTVDPGHWSVNPAVIFSTSSGYYDGAGHRIADPRIEQLFYNLTVTYGLSKESDIAATIGDSNLFDEHNLVGEPEGPPGPLRGAGLSDLTLSYKWRFHTSKDFNAAHVFQLVIPTGSNGGPGALGITQGYTTASYRITASKSSGRWSMNGDLALYSVLGHHSSGTTGTMNADLAAGYQCTPWMQPVVELNYLSTFYSSGSPSQALGVSAGVMLKAGETNFSLGAQKTVWGRNANDTLSTTLSVSFGF